MGREMGCPNSLNPQFSEFPLLGLIGAALYRWNWYTIGWGGLSRFLFLEKNKQVTALGGVMLCGNGLGRQEKESQLREWLQNRQFSLKEEYGYGKQLRRDTHPQTVSWAVKVMGERCIFRFARLC